MATDLLIHMVRHGETTANVRAEFIGTSDGELTERGEHQCHLLGIRLVNEGIRPFRLWTSPFERAARTAEILQRKMEDLTGHKPPLEYDDRLAEHQNGDWEGRPIAEIRTPEAYAQMDRLGMHFTPPNGESLWMVELRMVHWFRDCVASMEDWPNTGASPHLVAVSHGIAIKCLLHHIMRFNWRYTWAMVLHNTSITTLRLSNNNWHIDRLDDTRHLPLSY